MSNEYIKEYPLCFRAYLEDVKNEMVFTTGSESVFPESYIGSYLEWFIEKKGFNNLEFQLKEALAIIEELRTSNDYYADRSNWRYSGQDRFNNTFTFEDAELVITGKQRDTIGGKLARKTKKSTDERIEKLKKEVPQCL